MLREAGRATAWRSQRCAAYRLGGILPGEEMAHTISKISVITKKLHPERQYPASTPTLVVGHFFIHYGVMVYHHRTKCGGYHQKERENRSFFAYHHALACIKLRNDKILARKRDILVFGRIISSHFVSDDIHFLRKWLKLQALFVLAVKYKLFTLYPFRSIYGVSFHDWFA